MNDITLITAPHSFSASLDPVGNRSFRIADEPLLDKHGFLIKLCQFTLNDLVPDFLRLAGNLGLGEINLLFLFDR